MTKLSEKSPEKTSFVPQITKVAQQEKLVSRLQADYTECPRGFGYIRKIGDDGSVSERCLGCYEIMECYNENEWTKNLAIPDCTIYL